MIRGREYRTMHLCVFYGMLLLFAGSVLVGLELHFGLSFLRGRMYLAFGLILDLAGIALLAGLGIAAYKRYIVKPDRLENGFGDAFLLLMLAVVALSGFFVKGARLLAVSDPWAIWTPAGKGVAMIFAATISPSSAATFHQALWYAHATLSFLLIASIPWTKFIHVFAVPLSHYLSPPWGQRAFLSDAPSPSLSGAVADCTPRQLVEADACIACGRCKKRCSIYQAKLPSSPASMLHNLKGLVHKGRFRSPLLGGVIDESSLWACTGCRACEERCPINGAHAARVVDIRRGCVDAGTVPDTVTARFAENAAALAVGKSRAAETLPDGDVYLWAGCKGENEGEEGTFKKLERLLKSAGVTAAALTPPSCCGGPIRRLGNEALFVKDAAANIEYLKAIGGRTIVAHCPHCYNTLKNEYPRLGGSFHVVHHSQYLAGLLAEGRLKSASPLPLAVAFHDPCFLGRYNDEYASPRKLLGTAEGAALIELKHSRLKSLCCGSGGGTAPSRVALANGQKRIREAVKAGAKAIAVGCPYCRDNLAAAALRECPKEPPRIFDVLDILDAGEVQ